MADTMIPASSEGSSRVASTNRDLLTIAQAIYQDAAAPTQHHHSGVNDDGPADGDPSAVDDGLLAFYRHESVDHVGLPGIAEANAEQAQYKTQAGQHARLVGP